jgi:hypothetical protein
MAYIPRTTATDRRYLATGTGGAAGPASGGMPLSAPPQSPAGGQFAGLRAYFSANQPNAEGMASELADGLDTKAQDAVTKTGQARSTYESAGGLGLAADALAARDDARRDFGALGSQAGIASMLEQRQPSATYTAGMKNADAALLGRSGAINDARGRWGGVLGALDPTYLPGAPPQQPVSISQPVANKPIMDKSPGQGGGAFPDDEFPSRRRRRDAEVY